MRILITLFIILLMSFQVWSQKYLDHLNRLRAAKKYDAIVNIYKKNQKAVAYRTSPKVIEITLEALEATQQHLLAYRLRLNLISHKHRPQQRALISQIKSKRSVSPSNYSDDLKSLYFGAYQNLAQHLQTVAPSNDREKIVNTFNSLKKILEALEYEEDQVESIKEGVDGSFKKQQGQAYKFSKSVFLKQNSWQNKAIFQVAGVDSEILITNMGSCIGGSIGYQNDNYHFFADGCFIFGKGNVQAQNELVYQQSNVPFNAYQFALGASLIVSSSLAEFGVKVPVYFISQELTTPPDSDPECVGGCKIEPPDKSLISISLYGKWPFDQFYFLTEYGRNIKSDLIVWSLGLGYNF